MSKEVKCAGECHPVGGPGRFLLGEAQEISARLLEDYSGKIKLIYLDPPFGTGDSFKCRIANKNILVPAYADTLDREAYISMMRATLINCRELLSNDGSLYLHIDHRMNAHMRMLLDEIFGEKNFMNEIIWSYKSGGRSAKHFSRKHDVILFYRKSPRVFFDITAVGKPRGSVRRNHMKRGMDGSGRAYFSIRSGGKTYFYYDDEPTYPCDVWDDISHIQQRDPERTGYSTQKPEALLQRILLVSSKEGDLVTDFFSGSGTTAAAALRLNRRYIAADSSPLAMAMLRRRLLADDSGAKLLSPHHEMTLEYPDLNNAPISADLIRNDGNIVLRRYSGGIGLAYIAAGHIDGNGIFHPQAHAFDPTEGASLKLSDNIDEIIVQICYYDGSQAFLKLT